MLPTFIEFQQWLETNPSLKTQIISENGESFFSITIQSKKWQERNWPQLLQNAQKPISGTNQALARAVQQFTQQTFKNRDRVLVFWNHLQTRIKTSKDQKNKGLNELKELITKTFSPLSTLPNSFGGGEKPIVMNKNNEITLISNGQRVYSSKSLTEIITKLEQLIS